MEMTKDFFESDDNNNYRASANRDDKSKRECENDCPIKNKNSDEMKRLDEAIQEAVQAREWRRVHLLAWKLLALEEGVSLLSLPSALPWKPHSNPVRYDRLTVLQSQPLIRTDRAGVRHAIPPIDFEWEKQSLIEALKDASDFGTVEVVFDIATTDRLNSFFASGQSTDPVLHISGHGFVDGQLALENHGATHSLDATHLKDFRSSKQNQVVFISACHSRSVGEAFVNAGIPHVICCTNEGRLRDSAAIEFAKSLYRTLAKGNTLQEAFDLAKGQVKHSPHVKESHLEVDKFILLPEGDHHQVQVFFTRSCVQRQLVEETPSSSLPRPPDPKTFLGRQLEAYSIIEKLRKVDIVHLIGPSGIGKKSLAAFVANYVNERRKILFLDQVMWCPPVDPNSDGSLDSAFVKVYDLVATAPDILASDEYQQCKRRILRHLGPQRTLLVINTCELASADVAMLSHVLHDILNRVTSIKMLILSKTKASVQLSTHISQEFIELQPLTFDSTVTLFATHCEYVSQQSEHADPMVYSVTDFVNLIFRRDTFRYVRQVESGMPQRGRDLFGMLGGGHPQTILDRARSVSPDEYKRIIITATKFDVILPEFGTRYKLEMAILRTEMDICHEQRKGMYHKAQSLGDVVEDMKRLRENLPSKEKLEQLIEEGTKYKNDVANGLDRIGLNKELNKELKRLRDLQKALRNERKAEKEMEELPEGWLLQTQDVSKALEDVSDEAVSSEDIPPVAPMKVVDDESAIDVPNPEPVFIPLVTFRINASCKFILQINRGPVQSFAYHSSPRAAIVVASNEACTGGQGVLRSVTNAGGSMLLRDVEALSTVMDTTYGSVRCMPGGARIVGPDEYDQLQVKYVMFAVAPWFESVNASHARVFLTRAYRSALELAKEYKLEAVAFSLIGASCRGGKQRMETVRIAVDFCVRFEGYPELKEIHLFGFTPCEAKELEAASRAACEKFDMNILEGNDCDRG